ncbi:MAG: FISUMP domain-containing protein [Draconibacterium sp.]
MKSLLLLILSFAIYTSVNSQTINIQNNSYPFNSDSVAILKLPAVRGEVFWQQSPDSINWVTFSDNNVDSVTIDLKFPAFYRAKIVDGNCEPVYSETAKISFSDSINNLFTWNAIVNTYPGTAGVPKLVLFNNDTLAVNIVNDTIFFQEDIVLNNDQLQVLDESKGASIPANMYSSSFVNYWPDNTIYYKIDASLSGDKRIPQAIQHYEENTALRFVNIGNATNIPYYVAFKKDASSCWSNLGRQTLSNQPNIIALADWGTVGNTIHEIGHTAGLIHEQTRPDRDKYIIIKWDNIIDKLEYNFQILKTAITKGTFDFNSIMIYASYTNSSMAVDPNKPIITKLDGSVYSRLQVLSDGDIAILDLLYPPKTPTLTTTSVTDITLNSATTGGNVTSDGGTEVTSRGVCWSTISNPTITDSKTRNSSGTGSFVSAITGLTPGKKYYVRAYATNKAGTAYGNQVTFTTLSVPVVTTVNPSTITNISVVLGGNVASIGGAPVTERGVVYSKNQDPTILDSTIIVGTGLGILSTQVNGLEPYTKYYAKAYAKNEIGIGYGPEVTFTTLPNPAEVKTYDATEIATRSAVLNGEIISDGGAITQMGFVYNTSANPTTANTKVISDYVKGLFSHSIASLLPNTKYYVRAFATNGGGTSYGEEISFTTLTDTVIVSTLLQHSVTSHSAILGGYVSDDGGGTVTDRGIVYSTSINPTIENNKVSMGTGTGEFSETVSGLQSATQYFLKAFATNSVGVSYGRQIEFFTSNDGPPEVNTYTPTNVTSTSAMVGGEVIAENGDTVTECGVVFSFVNPLPNLSNIRVPISSRFGPFSQLVTLFSPDKRYYIRAYAINSFGVSYGEVVRFYTASGLAEVTTVLSEVTNHSVTIGGTIPDDGGDPITERGVVYSLSPATTITNATKVVMGSGIGSFSQTIPGLFADTLYFAKAYGINSVGASYGTEVIFRTETDIPTIYTEDATSITATGAYLGGNIVDDNGKPITERGIVYSSTNSNPNYTDSKIYLGSGLGNFGQNLSGLQSNTTYYFRAYAINGDGISFGDVINFKTLGDLSGTFIDSRDGNEYKWIQLGTQTWMAENLRWVEEVWPTDEISSTTPRYYVYNYNDFDTPAAKLTNNYQTYGVLYNWPAASLVTIGSNSIPSGIQGVCPSGWHLPSDAEWSILENYLIDNNYGYSGADNIAKSMASKTSWVASSTEGLPGFDPESNNSSGFNGMPGGWLVNDSPFFFNLGEGGHWWSATETSGSDEAWQRSLSVYYKKLDNYSMTKNAGLSVRCVKD